MAEDRPADGAADGPESAADGAVDAELLDVHRSALAVLVAVVDGYQGDQVHALLCRDDDPHYALRVAHHLALIQVGMIPAAEHQGFRAELAEELITLAQG